MILIGLGANLPSRAGSPAATLAAALAELAGMGARPVAVSSLYASHAWPDPNDPLFVNAVARIETTLSPPALLGTLNAVECSFGRVRTTPNAPRTLDLDILDYNGLVQDGPPILPHPRMHYRSFVLVPLADVAATWRHPVSQRTVGELIAALPQSEQMPAVLT
jgi:2-amino-4-hydroxy-6-hydroxymethyldihydropteridine diphosphokinase